jgi:hypothetical protein
MLREKMYFLYVKGKGKVGPVLLTEHGTMKAYWGSGRPLYTQGENPTTLFPLHFCSQNKYVLFHSTGT